MIDIVSVLQLPLCKTFVTTAQAETRVLTSVPIRFSNSESKSVFNLELGTRNGLTVAFPPAKSYNLA